MGVAQLGYNIWECLAPTGLVGSGPLGACPPSSPGNFEYLGVLARRWWGGWPPLRTGRS